MEIFGLSLDDSQALLGEIVENYDQENTGTYNQRMLKEYIVDEDNTDFNVKTTDEIREQWNNEIMQTEEDLDLASEPDTRNFAEEWGDLANENNDIYIAEHIAVQANKLKRKLKQFKDGLERNAGGNFTVDEIQEPKPQRRNNILFQRVVFALSNGQTISAVFEVLQDKGRKILPTSQMITFQFKVNGKDVTRWLYPNTSKKRTLRSLTKDLAGYVNANAENFAKKQARNSALETEISSVETEISDIDTSIGNTNGRRDQLQGELEGLQSENETLQQQLDDLREQLAALKVTAQATPASQSGENRTTDSLVMPDEVDSGEDAVVDTPSSDELPAASTTSQTAPEDTPAPQISQPEPEDTGDTAQGDDYDSIVAEILQSEDPVYIADKQEELEDALEAAGREDLLDAMDDRMNELSQRD